MPTRRASWISNSIMSGSSCRSKPRRFVIDDQGAVLWRGKCASTPDSITAAVQAHAPAAVQVGLETGQLSNWLTLNLRRRRVPVVCLDARHAKAALSLQINKTDANDAFGLAQIVRTGWYREVAVKSMDAHTLKMLLVARSQLVSQRLLTRPPLLETAWGSDLCCGSCSAAAARRKTSTRSRKTLPAPRPPGRRARKRRSPRS
jgi:Transposase